MSSSEAIVVQAHKKFGQKQTEATLIVQEEVTWATKEVQVRM